MVLGEYADTGAHWTVVVRPTVVAMAGAAIAQMALMVLRQSPTRSATVTIVLLLLLSGSRAGFAFVGAAGLIALLWFARRRSLPSIQPATAFVLAAAFLTAAVGRVFVEGTITVEDIVSAPRVSASAPATAPSIYIVVLDAYARQDTLASMGYDNEPFLAELERRGFDVYRDSRSNYTWTSSTLASMLNMRPLHEIPELPDRGSPDRQQTRALRRAINSAFGLEMLRENGYRLVAIPPLADYVVLRDVDAFLDPGQLTEFEIHLLQDTTLAGIVGIVAPDFVGAQHRDRISDSFARVTPQPRPTLLLAHVISPHHPFVFDAEGRALPMPNCFPRCWFWEPWDTFSPSEFAEGYVAQVQFVNRETLAAVDRVITGDPEAVVVIMGDHGSRGVPSDEDEQFRNLLTIRSPGHPRLLGDGPTPVNLLGSILGAYLDIEVPNWPDDQYAGRHLDAVRVAPVQ